MRRFLILPRRGVLLAALLCVLLARIAVPGGWMPIASAGGGIVLAPCSGMGAMAMALPMPDAPMMHRPGMTVHAADPHIGDKHHPDPAGDHPCSGAGVAVALAVPFAGPVATPEPVPSPVPRVRYGAAIGRGLAAPPPPSTGPPILA